MAARTRRRAISLEHRVAAILARALTSADPVGVIQRAARDRRTAAPLREALGAVDTDGLRISALLVARLRFERLIQGSREAGAWFERDPAAFSEAFRRYHLDVPPTACFPPEEAQLFARWHRAKIYR